MFQCLPILGPGLSSISPDKMRRNNRNEAITLTPPSTADCPSNIEFTHFW